ncbi:MAG: hypothetical protein R6W77_01310 [Trueperaceae bacterium]
MKQSAFFTFEIDGVRVGFYEEHDEPAASEVCAAAEGQAVHVLRMSAWIALGGAEHVNRFAVRYAGDEVLAYLDPAGAWVSVGASADASADPSANRSAGPSSGSGIGTSIGPSSSSGVATHANTASYPSAALPVLARRMQDGDEFSYLQIDEGLGRVVALATLRRKGDTVVETVDDEPRRRVVIVGGRVVAYGWGGSALSRRVPSRADAVRGTVFEGRRNDEPS